MTRRKRILLLLEIAVFAALALGALRFYRYIDYDLESPQLAAFLSPDESKSAYLLWHGALKGRTLSLFFSPTTSMSDARWLGSVTSDDTLSFVELAWSRDSSFVAARCVVGGYCKLPEGTKDTYLLTHGYDFASSKHLVPQRDVLDAKPGNWLIRDAKLEQLFEQKGGPLLSVSQDGLHDHLRKPKWLEWRQWRQILTSAGK